MTPAPVPALHTIVHVITGLGDGGAEGVLYRLLCRDTESRHLVVSLTDEGKYGPLLREQGIDVHCLRMARGRPSVRAFLRLVRLLRRLRPDLVQTWMYHADLIGGLAARCAGIRPLCWNVRHSTLDPDTTSRATILVARLCAALSGRLPARIICCAQTAADTHRAIGYAADRIVVIPNGYDTERLVPCAEARQAIRAELGVDDGEILIGCVARFHPDKDHATLAEALGWLLSSGHRWRCLLVGEGMAEQNAQLWSILQRNHVTSRCILLGKRSDIPRLMNALDVHVLASSSEGFPNALAEAMACGVPCVATDAGDARQIVGSTGWIVPIRSPQALATALTSAMDERPSADAWALRKRDARLRIEQAYSLDAMTRTYRELWAATAAGGQ